MAIQIAAFLKNRHFRTSLRSLTFAPSLVRADQRIGRSVLISGEYEISRSLYIWLTPPEFRLSSIPSYSTHISSI